LSAKDKLLASAQKYLQKGQIPKAIKDYKKLVEMDSKDIRHRQKLAELYSRVNQNQEALKEYEQVAKHYAGRGFYLKAIAVYKQIQKLDPQNAEVYFQLAELNKKQGLIGNALAELRALVSIYEKEDNVPETIKVLEAMRELDPENLNIRVKVAESYAKNRLQEKAFSELEELSAELRSVGDPDKLFKLYEIFLPLYPRELKISLGMADAMIRKGLGQKALSLLQGLLPEHPENPDILKLIAAAYRVSKDGENELLTYKHLLKLQPTDLDLRENFLRVCLSHKAEIERVLENIDSWQDDFLSAGREEILRDFCRTLLETVPGDKRINGLVDRLGFDRAAPPEAPAKGVQEAPAPAPVETPEEIPAADLPPVQEPPVEEAPEEVSEASAPEVFPAGEAEEIPLDFLQSMTSPASGKAPEAPSPEPALEEKPPATPQVVPEEPAEDLEIEVVEEEPPAPEPVSEIEEGEQEAEEAGDELVEMEIELEFEEDETIPEPGTFSEEGKGVWVESGSAPEPEPSSFEGPPGEVIPEEEASEQTTPETGGVSGSDEEDFEELSPLELEEVFPETEEQGEIPVLEAVEEGEEVQDLEDGRILEELEEIVELEPTEIMAADEEGMAEDLLELEPDSILEEEEESAPWTEELEEVEFYLRQGLLDDAERVCRDLLEKFPGEEKIEEKLELAFQARGDYEGEETEAGEEDYFDLGAEVVGEVEQEVGEFLEEAAPEEDDVFSLDGIFSDSQKGVETQIEAEDTESHYNLGIAYKEMGLLDEAIAEFDQASGSPQRRIDCLTLKGLCLVEKGNPAEAEEALRTALAEPNLPQEKEINLNYELGLLFQAAGRLPEALDCFRLVAERDHFFREVGEKISQLEGSIQGGQGGGKDQEGGTDPKDKRDRISYV